MKRSHVAMAAGAALVTVLFTAGTSSAQSTPEITFLHAGSDVQVDVLVGADSLLSDVGVGDVEDLSSRAGTQLVDVTVVATSDSSELVSAGTFNLPADGSHTLVFHLDATGAPVLTLFDNDLEPVTTTGEGRLTVRHVAAAPPVNVRTGSALLVTNLANGGSQSVELAAGVISDAEMTLTNGDPVASLPAITVKANVSVIVYVIGSAEDATIDFLNQEVSLPASAATTTTDPNATTTTADPNATTTTVDPNATTTTSTTTTTTLVAVPIAVNTGSPLDSPLNSALIAVAIGAFLVTGGAVLARRRVGS